MEPFRDSLNLNIQNIESILKSGVFEEIFSKSWAIESIEHGKMAICAETCNKDSWLNMLYIKE
jgi:hypothetical protein